MARKMLCAESGLAHVRYLHKRVAQARAEGAHGYVRGHVRTRMRKGCGRGCARGCGL